MKISLKFRINSEQKNEENPYSLRQHPFQTVIKRCMSDSLALVSNITSTYSPLTRYNTLDRNQSLRYFIQFVWQIERICPCIQCEIMVEPQFNVVGNYLDIKWFLDLCDALSKRHNTFNRLSFMFSSRKLFHL